MGDPTKFGHPDDRALAAVRRVRDSREKDSRFGLQHALSVVRERQADLQRAAERRATAAGFSDGSVTEFTAHLGHLAMLSELERKATVRAHDSRVLADEATSRWHRDRQQVRVVEGLLDRRAAAQAEELARREAAQLDDLATQAWLRRQAAALGQTTRTSRTSRTSSKVEVTT